MSDRFKDSKEGSFVTCDICEEVKAPALKTCLKCEISMCVKQLQTHLTSSVLLQTHPLTKPVPPTSTGQEIGRCSVHGKLVEYYCLDDHLLVCMSCAIEEGHRLHNMKTLQTAHKELVDYLRVKNKALADREKESKELESWYKEHRQTLENCVSQLMKTRSALEDLVLTSVETSVLARLGALQTAQQAISSALKVEDEFNFLQRFASVRKAVEEACMMDLRQGLEDGTERKKLVEEIRQHRQIFVEQALRLQGKVLAFVDPKNHEDPQYEAHPFSELTFDPKTLGPGMTLSEDHKTVFYSPASTNVTQLTTLSRTLEETQRSIASQLNQTCVSSQLTELSRAVQQTKASIDYRQPSTAFHHSRVIAPHLTQTVRCLQTNATGDLRWIVRLSEHFNWTIGICDENATRGNYSKVYGLKIKNETLSSLQTVQRLSGTKSLRKGSIYKHNHLINHTDEHLVLDKFYVTYPWKVEIIWDYTTELLTFYSRNKLTEGFLLLKLNISGFNHRLYPFVTMEPKTCDPQNRACMTPLMSNNKATHDISYTEILCALSN